MKDLLKWGLIGGGALYLFKDQLSAMLAGTQTATMSEERKAAAINQAAADEAANQNLVTQHLPIHYTAPQYYAPAAPNPQIIAAVTPVTEDLIRKASYDAVTAAILGSRALLSVHQWNFYREHSGAGGPQRNPGSALEAYGNPDIPIPATEYLSRLAASGLSGTHRRSYYR